MGNDTFIVLALIGCGSANPPPGPKPQLPPPPSSIVVIADPALRPPGPMGKRVRADETPWRVRQDAMRMNESRKIDKREMAEDLAAVESVLDRWWVPRTDEQREAISIRKQHVMLLKRLAPYSIAATTSGIAYVGERIWFCVRPPAETWPCDVDFRGVSPRDPAAAVFEVSTSGDITRLVVRDLSDASDPRWAGFSTQLPVLERARALIVDLRGAAGSDPRPLVAWLERATGRAMQGVIREVRRDPALTPYVDAYRARFSDDTRDAAVWKAFVGAPRRLATPPVIPIAVVVDGDCQAACELVARVLQTHGATVVGGVGKTGRIARDEPALLVLPHSQIHVYFHATEYLLATEIETATGPTDDWWRRQRDAGKVDDAVVVRELSARLANPQWPPRCAAFPARTREQLAAAPRAKIQGDTWLAHCRSPATVGITIRTNVPAATFQRFVASCPEKASLGEQAPGVYDLHTRGGYPLLSRLAQSELVESIHVDCQRPPEIDR